MSCILKLWSQFSNKTSQCLGLLFSNERKQLEALNFEYHRLFYWILEFKSNFIKFANFTVIFAILLSSWLRNIFKKIGEFLVLKSVWIDTLLVYILCMYSISLLSSHAHKHFYALDLLKSDERAHLVCEMEFYLFPFLLWHLLQAVKINQWHTEQKIISLFFFSFFAPHFPFLFISLFRSLLIYHSVSSCCT